MNKNANIPVLMLSLGGSQLADSVLISTVFPPVCTRDTVSKATRI